MGGDLVIEIADISLRSIYDKINIKVPKKGTRFFGFSYLFEGIIKKGSTEFRNRCMVSIYAANNQIFF